MAAGRDRDIILHDSTEAEEDYGPQDAEFEPEYTEELGEGEVSSDEYDRLAENGELNDWDAFLPGEEPPVVEAIPDEDVAAIPSGQTQKTQRHKCRLSTKFPIEIIELVADLLASRNRPGEIRKVLAQVYERDVPASFVSHAITRARQLLLVRSGRSLTQTAADCIGFLENMVRDDKLDPKVRLEAHRDLTKMLGAWPDQSKSVGNGTPEDQAAAIRTLLMAMGRTIPNVDENGEDEGESEES